MASYLPPNPVPTPYQPVKSGGNPNVPIGSTGPMQSTKPFIGPVLTYGQNSGGATNPINVPRSPAPNMNTYSVGRGGGGGGGGSTQPSAPSDADYDRVGVARGDRGGYDRVMREQSAKDSQRSQTYRTPEGFDFQGDQNAYMNEINNTFNNIMGYLSQNEGLAYQARGSAEQSLQSDLAANEALLGQQKGTADRQIQEQGVQANQKKENALDQARRLFQESTVGTRARFGGMSNVGQASSEILGRELQRNMGGIQQGAQDTERELALAARDVEEKFNAGKMQLQQSFQNAKAKIQQDFYAALSQINNMRGAAESEKGVARLNALKSVRDQVNQIKMQELTFAQQLEAAKQEQIMAIDTYRQTAGASAGLAQNSVAGFNPEVSYSKLGELPAGSFAQGQEPYIGQIGKSITRKFMGQDGKPYFEYSDGTSGPGGFMQRQV